MANFRVAVLVTIAFLALLMVVVALVAAIWDVSDRGLGVIGIVLTALTSLVGSVIVYLKIDAVEAKTDDAAVKAAQAARIGEAVHYELQNGGLRDNVKRAIQEDRHALRNRETEQRLRARLDKDADGEGNPK